MVLVKNKYNENFYNYNILIYNCKEKVLRFPHKPKEPFAEVDAVFGTGFRAGQESGPALSHQ